MRPPVRRIGGFAALLVALAALTIGAAPASSQAVVNDPGFSRQWGLAMIGAPTAWSIANGAGVTVAIVDSGIDAGHPDLAGQVVGIVDCVGHDEVPGGCVEGTGTDDAGHGTHVAGIVAAATNNGQGVAGVAPGAHLLGIKVLANVCSPDGGDADGDPECEAQGRESDVAQGVRWAADRGAAVINLSLGNEAQAIIGPGDDFAAALDYAWSRGSIPVLVAATITAGTSTRLPGRRRSLPATRTGIEPRLHA